MSIATCSILLGESLNVLAQLESERFQMVYIDPPFNTGKVQKSHAGEYADSYENYREFLYPRLVEARRVLSESGTIYVHLDYRESHRVKIMLDEIFGEPNFLNEIIWAYDYGGKSKTRWPSKHDTILVYVKNINKYYFNSEEVDREPYMAPGLVGPEKATKGKLPTDVWWHTIVPTNGSERTGYPTQKPEGILRRMVAASTKPGDEALDFFAGSGTTGAVAKKMGRGFVLADSNPQSVEVMNRRLQKCFPYLG